LDQATAWKISVLLCGFSLRLHEISAAGEQLSRKDAKSQRRAVKLKNSALKSFRATLMPQTLRLQIDGIVFAMAIASSQNQTSFSGERQYEKGHE
jgi:hypothetical protein